MAANVAFWPKADMRVALRNVCFRGKSGHSAEHLSLYGRITSEIERREQRQVVRAMTIDSISHLQTSVDGNGFFKVLSWTQKGLSSS